MKIYMTVSLLLCGLLNADILIPACQRDNDKNVVVCSETKLGKLIWQDDPKIFNGDWDKAKILPAIQTGGCLLELSF